jgi:hypothetical protein
MSEHTILVDEIYCLAEHFNKKVSVEWTDYIHEETGEKYLEYAVKIDYQDCEDSILVKVRLGMEIDMPTDPKDPSTAPPKIGWGGAYITSDYNYDAREGKTVLDALTKEIEWHVEGDFKKNIIDYFDYLSEQSGIWEIIKDAPIGTVTNTIELLDSFLVDKELRRGLNTVEDIDETYKNIRTYEALKKIEDVLIKYHSTKDE